MQGQCDPPQEPVARTMPGEKVGYMTAPGGDYELSMAKYVTASARYYDLLKKKFVVSAISRLELDVV